MHIKETGQKVLLTTKRSCQKIASTIRNNQQMSLNDNNTCVPLTHISSSHRYHHHHNQHFHQSINKKKRKKDKSKTGNYSKKKNRHFDADVFELRCISLMKAETITSAKMISSHLFFFGKDWQGERRRNGSDIITFLSIDSRSGWVMVWWACMWVQGDIITRDDEHIRQCVCFQCLGTALWDVMSFRGILHFLIMGKQEV